jgi:hypothetical protein
MDGHLGAWSGCQGTRRRRGVEWSEGCRGNWRGPPWPGAAVEPPRTGTPCAPCAVGTSLGHGAPANGGHIRIPAVCSILPLIWANAQGPAVRAALGVLSHSRDHWFCETLHHRQAGLRPAAVPRHSKLALPPNILRTWSKAVLLGASPRTGCVNDELTRVHLNPGSGRIILYRRGQSMAACGQLTWRHQPPLCKDKPFRGLS